MRMGGESMSSEKEKQREKGREKTSVNQEI